ncbi:MAG TPA: asparagine synthase (glutamine-hydrolyzing) [Patescibacteria group bacterium]|nr:asparagine synthase (glutamine-hydrolyzing) [Patescibacteria group bacterium]
MCGICGIHSLNPAMKQRSHIHDALEVMVHRGPDESGIYDDEHTVLGVRRLSIVDASAGSQPFYNEDKSVVVVSNGEIYNFAGIQKDLRARGHLLHTRSDTEVLAHLYEEYGTDLLAHIKGMFAFALWDKRQGLLFIARDRFGIKPLHYYYKNGTFAFASELKGLLQLPFVNRQLDLRALDMYFSLEYIPAPYSIFADIQKLRPGHYLLYRQGALETRKYWDLADIPFGAHTLSAAAVQDEFRERFSVAVKEHLTNEVPMGIFLSGGLDSSALVALAQKAGRQDISTFTIAFEEKTFDDSAYALCVSKHFGTRHHSYVFTADTFADTFSEVTRFLDEPLADLSIFPSCMLARFARTKTKVCLSGEGADELFMGYPTYTAHRYADFCNPLPGGIRRAMGSLAHALPPSYKYFSFDFKLKQFSRGLAERDPALRHLLWMGAFSRQEKQLLFQGGLAGAPSEDTPAVFLEQVIERVHTLPLLKQIQYVDIMSYLAADLLVKLDSASMLSSLEGRVPYLDHQLAEFLWGLDDTQLLGKKLLRQAMTAVLPRRILARPKKGFPIPFALWLRGTRIKKMIEPFFDEQYIIRQGLFNPAYLKTIFAQQSSGKSDHRKKIGAYIMFQAWHKNWCN